MLMTLANTVNATAAATAMEVTAVDDPQVTKTNSRHLLPQDLFLYAVYGAGTTIDSLKLDMPSLRSMFNPFIFPLDRLILPADEPNICDFSGFEHRLKAAEEIKYLTANSAGAAEQHYVISFLGDGRRNVTPGPCFTIQATATITTVANTWTSGALTFDQTLPAGRYSVIGMHAFGTGLISARLILPGQHNRPGCIAGQTAGNSGHKMFRMGRMGEYGTFRNTSLPALDVLKGSAAATSCTVLLDLVYLGP
jgi:hypothetical protein